MLAASRICHRGMAHLSTELRTKCRK